ncbi:glycosyltransferase family 2 protein [candidate division KSB1 bacterium]
MEKIHLSVVIPFFEEEDIIEKMLLSVLGIMKEIGKSFEIVCIDDGSKDRTWEILKGLTAENPEIRALRLSRNFGKESALCAGLENAKGDVVITIDGDMQHPPELIPEFIKKWENTKANVIEGVKVDRGQEGLLSKIGAGLFYSIISRLSGFDLKGASDFKLMDREFVDSWKQMPERSVFFRGMNEWLGYKREVIQFEVAPRVQGKSKWSLFSLIKLAFSGVTAFTSFPMHIITFAGLIFLVFSTLLGLQTLYNKFTGVAVDGFTTVILLLLIIGSVLMLGLGVIGEYISRIYNEVKNRPRYVISERRGIDKN